MRGHRTHRPLRRAAYVTVVLTAVLAALVGGCSQPSPSGPDDTGADPPPGGDPTRGLVWQPGDDPQAVRAAFKSTPWNNQDAPPPEFVASPNLPGNPAVKFVMPNRGKRTELEPDVAKFTEGQQLYFGFAQYLPEDFPVDAEDWQVVAQWKNEQEGSPPVEISIEKNQFELSGGEGVDQGYRIPIGPARRGAQSNIVVRVLFSSDPSKGSIDVWQNGAHTVRAFRPSGGTLYQDQESYLKVGLYRARAVEKGATLYLNDLRIADNYTAAANLAGSRSG